MIQNVFVIGATGKVGATLVHQIFEQKDTDENLHENPTRVVGLASSSTYLFSKEGISQDEAFLFLEKKEGEAYEELDKLIDIVSDLDDVVFVDVTAARDEMTAFHKKVITDTNHSVVTANKNPISLSDYEAFVALTEKPERYGYRCSVMAGAEAVTFLRDLKDVNDAPTLIQGCFSGTLGYICSELESGKQFSAIVKDALANGYTEPDPRDDLNGLDVARKLIVLARTAGYSIEMSDLQVEPFIPNEYFKDESVEEFLKSIKELDESFEKRITRLSSKEHTLRYVAEMNSKEGVPTFSVSLKEVSTADSLGSLRGTLNKIVVVSNAYPKESPYSVEAPGAGLVVTSQNIRRDLLYLLKDRKVSK